MLYSLPYFTQKSHPHLPIGHLLLLDHLLLPLLLLLLLLPLDGVYSLIAPLLVLIPALLLAASTHPLMKPIR